MKQTYIFCLLFISLFSTAQIINIPDANFKAKLLAASPSNTIASIEETFYDPDAGSFGASSYQKIDINNDGEIQVSEANLIKYLNISSSGINSLEGISSFVNLTNLKCSLNSLDNINISQNIPLKYLDCNQNQITALNVTQNTNLIRLDCGHNQLTNLNISSNSILAYLICYANQLTNLNTSSNTNLLSLQCGANQILNLNLTQNINLETLECANTLVTNLDLTQNTDLIALDIVNNSFTSLNVSQNTNLINLNCRFNQLTSLDLSNNVALKGLYCDNNQITSLDLTNAIVLEELYATNNNLTTLLIKNGRYEDPIEFSGNSNLSYLCTDELQSVSLQTKLYNYGYLNTCNLNTYCSFVPGGLTNLIQGNNKYDGNNDGCNIDDNQIPYFKYSISGASNTGTIISNNTGTYAIPVKNGSHTITPILENPNYFNITPASVTVDFPTQTSPFTQNFCISLTSPKTDLEISIIPITVARPGFDSKYLIFYKNKGNTIQSGSINLQFNDAVLDLVSSNPNFSTQSLNNLNWTYNNLYPFESKVIEVDFNVNSPMETPAVNAGDILNYTATITQSGTDEIISDNTFLLRQTVVNAFDPNDKTCLQGATIPLSQVGKYVHYMIRFENTGNFPAENIVVKDVINTSKFDISTLIPLYASHNYVTKINYETVEFIFENINLPFDDANNDGYVAFKIKTLPFLGIGNSFSNSANIYFDYNFPILTNTATTTIAALNNPSFEFENYFSLYPNPTTNELNIKLKSAIEINSIQIYNTIGQLVTVQTGNALKIDVSNLKTGNYFIKINTIEGFSTSQFIKE